MTLSKSFYGSKTGLRGGLLTIVLIVSFFCPVVQAKPETDDFSVALTGKYPPFSFYDKQGQLAGFDVDVSREIAKHLGRSLTLVPTEWDGILVGLLGGKFDAIIGSMAITPAREKQVNFSAPYYYSGAQLFIHKDNQDSIQSIEDCCGKPVGVVAGETFEQFLREKYPKVKVVTYQSAVDIFQDLRNGRLAGFLSDLLVGTRQIEDAGEPFVLAGPLLYRERMGIPVRVEDEKLLEAINVALADIRKSGKLEEIAGRWLGAAGKQAVSPPEQECLDEYATAEMPWTTSASLLLRAFGRSMLIAFASLFSGFLLAIPLGAVLNRNKGLLCWIARGAVDFVRGTPVLIQLFFVHFGLPSVGSLVGKPEWGVSFTPMISAVITLGINSMAYMSEVVRAGLMSVDRGQRLAGRALGLSRRQVFRHVVWPQAFRIAVPPLMNSVVALIKDTALVGIISVSEAVTVARSIVSATYNPVYYLIVAVLFFVVTFPLMKLAGRLERKMKERGFAHD